ncbi:hypothetical protein AB0N07_49485 [Streptomyces sp. NPDC051172]|uniref:hypothetical protein n=1 Tax=Streptomyces sp. NPDC051172 TaxID=3155796 RepID=UPI00343F51BC
MTEQLPATTSVRISLATFDPARFAEVDAANKRSSKYLTPAIQQLPGLIHYYAAISPQGSMVNVSIWDTEEHAQQMGHLKEMVVLAAEELEAAGATFVRPIVNHTISWTPSDEIQF